MLNMRHLRTAVLALLGILCFCCPCCRAQAALLMEEPYGFFGAVNPTGHNAIYLQRVCADTPVHLRRCHPGELGSVISRYQGIAGYDWIAVPLVPYLYAVDNPDSVPDHVDHDQVRRMRNRYRERHLESLGDNLRAGNLIHGGWTELVGAAYERRIYAYRFNTTPEQDDALIAWLNTHPNQSHFDLLFNNCADYARRILDLYFPGVFRRSIFPDAGVTTPKQIAFKLVRYAHRHPQLNLNVFEIEQIPGYRRSSRSNKSIAESFVTTGYAVPITLFNPYIAGGLLVDYLVRGRFHIMPKHPEKLEPDNLLALTVPENPQHNARNADLQAPETAPDISVETQTAAGSDTSLKESLVAND